MNLSAVEAMGVVVGQPWDDRWITEQMFSLSRCPMMTA
jgi:hypothetical protein